MEFTDEYSQFAAVRESNPDGQVLHVFGDVDVLTAQQFEDAILEAAAEQAVSGGSVTVNFTRCRYLDSSGLAVLVRARRRLGSHLSILVTPRTMISRVLHITSLDRVFNVVTELRPSFETTAGAFATDTFGADASAPVA